MIEKIKSLIIEYGEELKHRRLLKRWGGLTQCPYCLQVMQTNDGALLLEHPHDPIVDILECSVCSGQSIWKFEIGFFYVGPYKAPEPKHDTWGYELVRQAPGTE